MTGAVLRILDDAGDAERLNSRPQLGADDRSYLVRARTAHRIEDVLDHRSAAQFVKHFRRAALHARAFAGSHDDRARLHDDVPEVAVCFVDVSRSSSASIRARLVSRPTMLAT